MGTAFKKNDKGRDVKLKSLNLFWDVFEVLSMWVLNFPFCSSLIECNCMCIINSLNARNISFDI